MLPIVKKSVIRSTLLLGASALTLGVGADLATIGRANAAPPGPSGACTFIADPLTTAAGSVTAASATPGNDDFCALSTSLSTASTSLSQISSSVSNTNASVS